MGGHLHFRYAVLERLIDHLQPAWVAWYLPYDADAGNFTSSSHKSINALLGRGVHYCPGSPILCVYYVLLHIARRARQFKRYRRWDGNQVVIGIEDIHRPSDAVMKANRKTGRLRKKTQDCGLTCRHNIE